MVRKCTQCLMLRSPSFVSLYARHLLPFGRRLLWSCSWQAKKVCCCIGTAYRSLLLKEKPFGECTLQLLPSVALDFRTQSRPRGTPMKSAQDVWSTAEGKIFK